MYYLNFKLEIIRLNNVFNIKKKKPVTQTHSA